MFLGIWGEAELILGIWGAKAKYFHGAGEIILRYLGRSMHYFREQGSADPPPPPGGSKVREKKKLCRA